MSDIISRKITFTATTSGSGDIGPRTLVLLLAFDFAASNVQPLPSRQEQYPVVWKILKFQKSDPGSLVHVEKYTDRLAFTKAERLLPSERNPGRWILSPNPKIVQEVNATQETMLVQDPNSGEYSFAPPIKLSYPSSVAMNGVQDPNDGSKKSQVHLAFGFYETIEESKPAQIICFHEIPQYTPVALQFVPVLQAYFVPEDFYSEGEVLTMPISTQVALQVDIRSLSEDQKYSVYVDETNRARIKDPSKDNKEAY